MKNILVICLLLFISGSVKGQETNPLPIKDSIFSKALNENREFQVLLPKDYNSDGNDTTYEVLYVLDGQYYIKDVPFIYNWTVQSGYMPELILVIIPNVFIEGDNQRWRDFTPTIPAVEEIKGAVVGGADNFLSFLRSELIPHVEKTYRTNTKKSLLGSSLSGLFVTYAFVQNPNFFNSYVASDPALWWDDQYVGNLAAEKLPDFSKINSTFWIAGLEHSYEGMGIKKIDSVFTSKKLDNSKFKVKLYSNETHFSVQLKAFYDGLRFSYFGYDSGGSTRYHPKNGILAKGKPVAVHIFNADTLLKTAYTTDGTEPVKTSKRIYGGDDITITSPTNLKIKTFGNRQDFNTLEEANFKFSSLLPKPTKKARRDSKISYSYFQGTWESFPDSKTLKPTHTETIDKASKVINLKKGKSDHIHFIESDIKIDNDGYYIFGIVSNEGAKLSLGDVKLMEFGNENDAEQSFVIPLKKGVYPIRLEIFTREESGEINFSCYYVSGDTNDWWESEIDILPKIGW